MPGLNRRFIWPTMLGLWLVGSHGALADEAVEAGEKVYKKCKACHKVGATAKNGVGPHLNDLFGREAGTIAEFRYSKALKGAAEDGLVWDETTLLAYLENPKKFMPGTRMSFRGLTKEKDRLNVLAYLRTYSGDPEKLTEVVDAPTLAPEILAIQGDPAYGEYLSGDCTTCHKRDGSDDGIPNITGWPVDDFVIAMHAYKNKELEHPVMQMMAGRLSNEEIAGLAAYFASLN